MLDLNLEGVFVLSLSKPGLLLNANLTCCFKVLKQNKDESFTLKSPKKIYLA